MSSFHVNFAPQGMSTPQPRTKVMAGAAPIHHLKSDFLSKSDVSQNISEKVDFP